MKGSEINNINRPLHNERPVQNKAASRNGESTSRWWQKEITFSKGLSDKVKEIFYLELFTLLEAGVEIRTAIDLVAGQQKNAFVKKIFTEIQEDIVKGATFSDSLKKHGSFSNYEIFSVNIGEETGRLPIVLKDLQQYYYKKIRQRRQITGALTYPAIVLTVAIIAVVFMTNFIVPMFADIFKRFNNGELPAITRVVVNVSSFIQKSLWLWLLTIAAGITFIGFNRKSLWYRKISSGLLLRTPVVGNLIRKIYLARMCNSLALLISSKVPILQAIQLVRLMIPFYPIQSSLAVVENDILEGRPLHKSLEQHSIYPPKLIAMVKVGEEVNQLSGFFSKVNEQYLAEIEYDTSVLSNLMEPFIIIFLGLVVGLILIAMYLPLFQLGNGFE